MRGEAAVPPRGFNSRKSPPGSTRRSRRITLGVQQKEEEQFFTDEAALGPIMQIVENRLLGFDERPFDAENF